MFSDDQFVSDERKPCAAATLYLFARTSREKEDWFLRLSVATGAIDKFQRGFKKVYSNVRIKDQAIRSLLRLARSILLIHVFVSV